MVLSALAFPSESVEFCVPQRFPGGAQLQGAAQAGKGFLTPRRVAGFLVGIEPFNSGDYGFLAIDKVPVSYQRIQLCHCMRRQQQRNVVRIWGDRHKKPSSGD
jgi:hypothetical protein